MLSAVKTSSVMELFEETGAYLRGHFQLTSGLHSGEYLQCAKVLAIPAYAERLGRELAGRVKELAGGRVEVVVSPAMGGVIIGHEVARALGARSLFAERDGASNQMMLRRGFAVERGERTVVIEDVVTTGGSTKEVVELVRNSGGEVLAAGSIIDRSNGRAGVGVARVALENLDAIAYPASDCPLCREGQPIVKPGSRRA